MLRSLVLLVFLVVSNLSFAQWTNIPNPSSVFAPSDFPTDILPVANNKILYAKNIYVSPSSGGYGKIYKANDAGIIQDLTPNSNSPSYGCCNFTMFSSVNDSSFCFHTQAFYNNMSYTYNNLVNSAWYFAPSGSAYPKSTAITSNFVYSTSRLGSTDTLYLVARATASPYGETIIKHTDYETSLTNQMKFVNDSSGFILLRDNYNNNKSVLIKITDFGMIWDDIHIDSVNQITSFSFPDENTGYITKTNGSILKTTDGGVTWISLTSPTTSTINCIKFTSGGVGFIGGPSGFVKKSVDGGVTWLNQTVPTNLNIKDFFIFGSVAYFSTALTTQGLYKTTGLPIGIDSQEEFENSLNIFPNPSVEMISINFSSAESGNIKIIISDPLGKIVSSYSEESTGGAFSKDIPVNELAAGIYLFTVKQLGKSYYRKLIINAK